MNSQDKFKNYYVRLEMRKEAKLDKVSVSFDWSHPTKVVERINFNVSLVSYKRVSQFSEKYLLPTGSALAIKFILYTFGVTFSTR